MIRPALEAGRTVVADRFADSSVAYQGAARGLGTSHVLSLTDDVIDGLWPDVTVLLRVDPETGLDRADGEDRFESEGLELQRAVAEAYEEIAQIASDRVVVVDGSGSVDEVHERVMEAVGSRPRDRPCPRVLSWRPSPTCSDAASRRLPLRGTPPPPRHPREGRLGSGS